MMAKRIPFRKKSDAIEVDAPVEQEESVSFPQISGALDPLDGEEDLQVTAPVSAEAILDSLAQFERTSFGGAGPKEGRLRRRVRRIRLWHWMVALALVVMVAVVALAGFYAWDRWSRFDDGADIQGTWYVIGTDVPIQITNDQLQFTDDVSYHYTLDASSKSLDYQLGNLDGQSHYWFIDDRQVLVIADGSDFTRWGTAWDDLLRQFSAFADVSAGKGAHLPKGDDVVILCREPNYVEPGLSRGVGFASQPADAAADPQESGGDASGLADAVRRAQFASVEDKE